jgi:butyryl-CoA dehydrogenase
MFTMHFFFRYELPKILGLEKRLMDSDGLTIEMEAQFFND